MKRSPQKLRRNRTVVFEALQARELMAGDVSLLSFDSPAHDPKILAEQWADLVLGFHMSQGKPPVDPLGEMRKFASAQEAMKHLTDAFAKDWQDLFGKPLDDKINHGYSKQLYDPVFAVTGIEDTAVNRFALTPSTNSASAFSNSTSNRVSSVDEGDQFEVSSDGYVFTLVIGREGNYVKVFDARDPKDLVDVATIRIQGFSAQMHLVGDQLILVSSDFSENSRGLRIQVYDVSDPATPTLQTNLTASGANQQSRFADGKLTLFSSQWIAPILPLFFPDDRTAVYSSLTDVPIGRFETAEEYTARVQPLVISWLLPDIQTEDSDGSIDIGDWSDLVVRSNGRYTYQTTVLSFALDGNGLKIIDTETLIGASMTASYVDDNTVYIANSVLAHRDIAQINESFKQQSQIYAIELGSDSVDFIGTGIIQGTVRDSRMMDEHQGNLRVFSNVSSWSNPGEIGGTASTNLYILKANAGKLDIVGQLEDVADGQALYSAYFDEDKAFITTWVSQVPNHSAFRNARLHSFDLSDPTNPVELSELVIPGVSTYLQRVDSTHLVGIGYIDVGTGEWRQQISLYDIADLSNLKVVDTWISEQIGFSPNFYGWNQDALAVSFNHESGLFSIALSAFGSFISRGLNVFKIDASAEDPLRFLGETGDGRFFVNWSTVVGDTLLVNSNIWLQTYSIEDVTAELDHALLVNPVVSDWYNVVKNDTVTMNLLSNDYFTDTTITAISSSKLGTVKILEDGASIQYQASDFDSPRARETLTYTVRLKNGDTYSGPLNINVIGADDGVSGPVFSGPFITTEPIISGPILVDPVPTLQPTLEQPTLVEKTVAIDGDINGDGELAPQDVLLLVDYLNERSERLVAGESFAAMSAIDAKMDLSGDGEISPIDILIVVERLNAKSAALLASGEGPDDVASAVVYELRAADEALLSLLAANTAGQEETLPAKRRR